MHEPAWCVAVSIITEDCGTLLFLPHALLHGYDLMNIGCKLSLPAWSVAVSMITEVCGTLPFLPTCFAPCIDLLNPVGKLST